jgi:hypothetical protein
MFQIMSNRHKQNPPLSELSEDKPQISHTTGSEPHTPALQLNDRPQPLGLNQVQIKPQAGSTANSVTRAKVDEDNDFQE